MKKEDQTKPGASAANSRGMMKRHAFPHTCAAVLMAAALTIPTHARDTITSLADLKPLEQQVTQVAQKVMPATVALVAEKTGASGSGVITSADGLILTAAHVVQGVEEMSVVFPNGKKATGKVLGANYSKDIGMVKIQEPGPWPFVERASSKDLAAGDWLIAMGHSAGFDPNRTPPVRFGRVISKGPGNFFTSDCTLIGGDSGGPIYDLKGRIVGINSSIGTSWKNNNHAGVDGFRDDWNRLMAGEMWGELSMNPFANPEAPVLGIQMAPDNKETKTIRVEGITQRSPAAQNGVRIGDEITSLDGATVTTNRDFRVTLAKKQAGDKVKIGLKRDDASLVIEATLVKREALYSSRHRSSLLFDQPDQDEERDVPLLSAAENDAVTKESKELFSALKSDAAGAAASVVEVYSAGKQVAYGTVVGDGRQILTKWSELAGKRKAVVQVLDHSNTKREATITGVYEDQDLAVLSISEPALTPVKWSTATAPAIGKFLVAPSFDGKAASFGVVSVAERSLRVSTQAFLGIRSTPDYSGPGVKVEAVEPKAGAAIAGLLKGDLIMKVGERAMATLADLQNAVSEKKPGDHVSLHVSREGKLMDLDVLLGNFPLVAQPFNPRLRVMERMGGEVSKVHDAFPDVIQTDMQLEAKQCGGPVIDLAGNFIGISIARADRTRSLIIPAAALANLQKTPIAAPAVARIGPAPLEGPQIAGGPAEPRGGQNPGQPQGGPGAGSPQGKALDARNVRRHMRDIQRLRERIQDEMDDVEGIR